MRALKIFMLTVALAWSAGVSAQEERVDVTPKSHEPVVSARLGIGMTVDPQLLGAVGSIEVQVDRFFSVGPMLLLGYRSSTRLFVPTLAARFILPASVMKEKISGWPGLEFSLHTGFGVMVRDQDTFRFTEFAYQAGLNADWYVMDELTVGLGGSVIVTSSSVETAVGLLYASVAYHY